MRVQNSTQLNKLSKYTQTHTINNIFISWKINEIAIWFCRLWRDLTPSPSAHIYFFFHVIRFFHAITRWFINNCFDRIAATSRIMHNIIFRTHYCGNIFLYYFCFSAFSFADCRRGLDDVMVSFYRYQIKTKDFWRGFFFYVRLRYKSHVEIIHGYIAWNMTNVQQQKRVYAIYP